jgi:hypothetical protein
MIDIMSSLITMAYYMFIPATIITLIASVLAWQAWRYRTEQKNITHELAEEASKLIDKMQTTGDDLIFDASDFSSLGNPTYLATLCTILVHKAGGAVRLTEQDFLDLPEAEYISVYVDTNDASILLCLHSLGTPPSSAYGEDETTYN